MANNKGTKRPSPEKAEGKEKINKTVSTSEMPKKCLCAALLKKKTTKDGRAFYACDQNYLSEGKWIGGCKTFLWEADFLKSIACQEHSIIKCACLADPRVTEALKACIECFCNVPARAGVTKTEPAYVFLNCGSKRFKNEDDVWASKCSFWARFDEWDSYDKCDECAVPMSRRPCARCKTKKEEEEK